MQGYNLQITGDRNFNPLQKVVGPKNQPCYKIAEKLTNLPLYRTFLPISRRNFKNQLKVMSCTSSVGVPVLMNLKKYDCVNFETLWTFEILHICELGIYVSKFVHFHNFETVHIWWTRLVLPPDCRQGRLRRHFPSYNVRRSQRANKESVFCRKLSKIYPPCQNPDRSSYRLLNRLTRKARVFHQMKRADGSKILICGAEQYATKQGNPQDFWALPAPG